MVTLTCCGALAKVFWGCVPVDLLRASGAEQAKLFVVAIDDREKALTLLTWFTSISPENFGAGDDRRHAYELLRRGVEVVERETFGSAVDGVEALKLLGVSHKAHRAARTFKEHDEQALQEIADVMGDETVLVARSRQLARDLGSYCAQTTKT